MTVTKDKVIIGWSELVDFPDWGIRRLRAKIDTGARSSALHVDNIVEIDDDLVAFDVVLHRKRHDRRVHIEAVVTRRGRVRSSTGISEPRLFVATTLRLGAIERKVEISLVDRGRMTHRAILGRTALDRHFLIDATHRNLLARPRKRRRKKRKA